MLHTLIMITLAWVATLLDINCCKKSNNMQFDSGVPSGWL